MRHKYRTLMPPANLTVRENCLPKKVISETGSAPKVLKGFHEEFESNDAVAAPCIEENQKKMNAKMKPATGMDEITRLPLMKIEEFALLGWVSSRKTGLVKSDKLIRVGHVFIETVSRTRARGDSHILPLRTELTALSSTLISNMAWACLPEIHGKRMALPQKNRKEFGVMASNVVM